VGSRVHLIDPVTLGLAVRRLFLTTPMPDLQMPESRPSSVSEQTCA
jgi:hypothetical protein